MDAALKRKIGQMLVAGFPGAAVDEQARRLVGECSVGNFVLFARNIVTPEQTAALCAELRALTEERTGGVPPFVTVDQEGGPVSRVHTGAALIPGAMALAASGMEAAYPLARHCGRILRALGINVNQAPVLDVNLKPKNPIIGTRSFGDDPGRAARLGVGMCRGFTDGGVMPVVKHYPGHGNVTSDSHREIPVNAAPRGRLERTEWLPFRHAFAAGAPALMTAHVLYPAVDPALPATLSPALLGGLLRGEMGFRGLVFSDCMEMEAIRGHFDMGEAAVMAVEAGCDLLLFSHTLEAVDRALRALYDAVKAGRLREARLDRSIERIMSMKRRYGLLEGPQIDARLAADLCADEQAQSLCDRVARQAVTLLSGDGGAAGALRGGRCLFLAPESLALTGAEDERQERASLAPRLKARFGGFAQVTPLDGSAQDCERALALPFDTAVMGLYNARVRPGQVKLLRRLERTGKPLIAVLLGAPYDAGLIRRADMVIAAYEYTPLSVAAVLHALDTGEFPGALPVRLQ